MNELQSILDAYGQAHARGERMALATVVSVEGSAYRRPGARMLIAESGQAVGAISGGCLERDVMERAAQVIKTHTARIIAYDTRGNEDIVWGLGLGCNGVVRVLLESLHEGSSGARALQFIADCLRARRRGVMATVIAKAEMTSCEGGEHEIGERLIFDEYELHNRAQSLAAQAVEDNQAADALDIRINKDARRALMAARSSPRVYETDVSRKEIFFDVIEPPRPLVIFGAEQDAVPVVRLARTLGWHVTIVDPRARHATTERFKEADAVVLCRAEDAASRVTLAPDTAAVVMTHNYLHDVELLRALLPAPVSYLGILGPKERTVKLLEELRAQGCNFSASQLARLHSPIGMDIGAETPEEIALAIIAEIKAACAARRGGFLRDRAAPIHDHGDASLATIESSVKPQRVALETALAIETDPDSMSADNLMCYLS